MKQEEQQAIALAKYAAIAPLVTDQADEYQKRGEFYIAASKKGVRYPDGTLRHPPAVLTRYAGDLSCGSRWHPD